MNVLYFSLTLVLISGKAYVNESKETLLMFRSCQPDYNLPLGTGVGFGVGFGWPGTGASVVPGVGT